MRCIVKLYIVAKHHGMKRGILFTLGWIVLLAGCATDTVEPVYVGTSSNMQQAMVELGILYQTQPVFDGCFRSEDHRVYGIQ